jgi:hypothetical protein
MFSFATFQTMVQAANDRYEKWKQSSLHDLIDILARDGTRAQALQAIDRLPFKKQYKYNDAVEYVRKQYKASWATSAPAPKRVAPPPQVMQRPAPAPDPTPPLKLPRIVAPPPVTKALVDVAKNQRAAFHPFQQGDSRYLAHATDGFCAAASMAYVKSKRSDPNKRFEYFSEKARTPEAERKRAGLIRDIYAGDGVKDQLKVIQSTLGTRYDMANYGHFEGQNVTVGQLYQETYQRGRGHYVLFLCIMKGRADTGNHFMAISIGETQSTFFDPNEGEVTAANGAYWPLLWSIFQETYLKTYMPDNIGAIDRYFKA